MRSMHASAVLSLGLILLLPTPARAEDSNASQKAAGWAVLGLGTALGLGSVATGLVMTQQNGSSNQEVGTATLIGGGVTTVVGLAVGLPLILSSSGSEATRNAMYLDALSGRFRW